MTRRRNGTKRARISGPSPVLEKKSVQEDNNDANQKMEEQKVALVEIEKETNATGSTQCEHVENVGTVTDEVNVSFSECLECGNGTKCRWLCLHKDCLRPGHWTTLCGAKEKSHSLFHFEQRNDHSVFANLLNARVFCLACNIEVDCIGNVPKFPNETRESLSQCRGAGRMKRKVASNPERPQSETKQVAQREKADMRINEPMITRGKALDSFSLSSRPFMKDMTDSFDDTMPKGLTGLRNVGNTCYFNASLQALSNCPPFSDFFRDQGDLRCFASREPIVSNQLAMVFQRLWAARREPYISPEALLMRVRDVFTQFRGYHQQDSQELIRCLLDLVHRELGQPVFKYEKDWKPRRRRSSRQSSSSSNDSDLFGTADSGWSSDGNTPSTSSDSLQAHSRQFIYGNSVFDGTLESSVKCLTCQNVSTTTETFQDLSLPIPNYEQLSHLMDLDEDGNAIEKKNSESSGWFSWLWWMTSSLFVSSPMSLEDCFRAFFSPDRLFGDDMYFCEKCKMLRNGVKSCRMSKTPEVLCIHVKRFRHDPMSSGKISTRVSFPMANLQLSQFCAANAGGTDYELCAFVTHEGSGADCGHYLAYCRNEIDGDWYEYDDSMVTKLDAAYVLTKEAYVLFYQKKVSKRQEDMRLRVAHFFAPTTAVKNFEVTSSSYISSEWLCRLSTFAEPGPITNLAFLCRHGHILPHRADHVTSLCTAVPKQCADELYKMFGGGPRVKELHYCLVCDESYRRISDRRKSERRMRIEIEEAIRASMMNARDMLYANYLPMSVVANSWWDKWERFLDDSFEMPPGPIDNKNLLEERDGRWWLTESARKYNRKVHRELFVKLKQIYGGGPDVLAVSNRPQYDEKEFNEILTDIDEKRRAATEIVARRMGHL